jgi:hypothetical protein
MSFNNNFDILYHLIEFNKSIKYNKNTSYETFLKDIDQFKNLLNFEANEKIMNTSHYLNNDGTLEFLIYKEYKLYDINYIILLYIDNYKHLSNNILELRNLKKISLKIMDKIRRHIPKI